MKRVWAFVLRCVRAARHLQRDERIPRWVRAAFAFTTLCLWLPGPLDELAIACVLGFAWFRHRECVRDAWTKSALTADI